MDVNKGRFAEIFPVVTTVYKSTSPMDFVAVLKWAIRQRILVLHYHKCEPLIISEILHISPFLQIAVLSYDSIAICVLIEV